ncbi:hypothetical protein HPB50_024393 [Hyalomma asiaticum]|uniref:Uncharacterized protein n=1 Tax=Hyalomma asiaticum TaxID=266040 RepID=A0ACB7S9Y5_HYAAI|nr:hypothetical protein HPB50_024393 [Hyalomma asiaticum]
MAESMPPPPSSPSPRRSIERTPARRRAESLQCSRMLELLLASAEAVRLQHKRNERLLRAAETRPFNAHLPALVLPPAVNDQDSSAALPAAPPSALPAGVSAVPSAAISPDAPATTGPSCDPAAIPLPQDSDGEPDSDDEGSSRKVPAIAPEVPHCDPPAVAAPSSADVTPAPNTDDMDFQVVQTKAQKRREHRKAAAAAGHNHHSGKDTPAAPPASLPPATIAAPVDLLAGLESEVPVIAARRRGTALILDFAASVPPARVRIFRMAHTVRNCRPRPLQCQRCGSYGHATATCSRTQRCLRCGGVPHGESSCTSRARCLHCGKTHAANSPNCQLWQRERRLATIKATAPTFIPHREAVGALQQPASLPPVPSPAGHTAGLSYAQAARPSQKGPRKPAAKPRAPPQQPEDQEKGHLRLLLRLAGESLPLLRAQEALQHGQNGCPLQCQHTSTLLRGRTGETISYHSYYTVMHYTVSPSPHRVTTIFLKKIDRLEDAGYPQPVLLSVADTILKKPRTRHLDQKPPREKDKVAAILPLALPGSTPRHQHPVARLLPRDGQRFTFRKCTVQSATESEGLA